MTRAIMGRQWWLRLGEALFWLFTAAFLSGLVGSIVQGQPVTSLVVKYSATAPAGACKMADAPVMVPTVPASLWCCSAGTWTNCTPPTGLPADPAACPSHQWVTDQNASGVLTCAQPAFSDLTGAATDGQVPDTITVNLAAAATALAANGGNCTAGQAALGVDASGAAEGCWTPSGSGDMATAVYDPGVDGTVDQAAHAATASALSANGGNCSAGQAPLGVDASGAAEGCWTPGVLGGSGTSGFLAAWTAGTALGNTLSTWDSVNLDLVAGDNGALAGQVSLSTLNDDLTTLRQRLKISGGGPSGAAATGTVQYMNLVTGTGGTIAATTAAALAANPADCSANQYANAIAASGNLTCAALTDADVPNTITVNVATKADELSYNPGDCSAGQFAVGIGTFADLSCAALTDADVPNDLTITSTKAIATSHASGFKHGSTFTNPTTAGTVNEGDNGDFVVNTYDAVGGYGYQMTFSDNGSLSAPAGKFYSVQWVGSYITTVSAPAATADRAVTFPNKSGVVNIGVSLDELAIPVASKSFDLGTYSLAFFGGATSGSAYGAGFAVQVNNALSTAQPGIILKHSGGGTPTAGSQVVVVDGGSKDLYPLTVKGVTTRPQVTLQDALGGWLGFTNTGGTATASLDYDATADRLWEDTDADHVLDAGEHYLVHGFSDLDGTATSAQVPLSGTASALAADPANCSAGSFPLGVTAAGVVEGCTAAFTAAGVPAAETDAAHDTCVEISGCVVGAYTAVDAVANGATKGISTFTAADFNTASGVVSIDYTNGTAAATGAKGFLTSTDWNTFNGKQAVGSCTNQFPRSATSSVWTCASVSLANDVTGTLAAASVGTGLTDAQVSDTLTCSIVKGSGTTTDAVDLATAEVAGTLAVGNGGTGATTLTNHGVMLGQATAAVVVTAAGTAGQALLSGGASADPAFAQYKAGILQSSCYGAFTAGAATDFMADGFGGVQKACASLGTTRTGGTSVGPATWKNLRVKCGTAGKGAGSGIFTVEKAASATTLTCTVGTGTTCTDVSHSFTTTEAQLLTISVARIAAETLANCAVTLEEWYP